MWNRYLISENVCTSRLFGQMYSHLNKGERHDNEARGCRLPNRGVQGSALPISNTKHNGLHLWSSKSSKPAVYCSPYGLCDDAY